MQTRALKSLVRVSRAGSFAKAAAELNMTLSALSMQMKSLEAELGVSLFDRSVRPPRLTPIGRSVVAEAAALLKSEASLVELCRPKNALVGQFKIGFVTTAAVRLLPNFLKNARSRAPEAEFEFETGLSKNLQSKVVNGRLDAAVVTDADGLPGAVAHHVLRREPFVFAAHERLLSDGLDGLIRTQAFFHFMPDTGIGKLIAAEIQAYPRPPRARTIVLDNLEAIMECVATGLGFTLLPVPDVTRYRSDAVRMIDTPTQRKRTLVLISAGGGALADRRNALAELFQEP